ncbi:MAG: diguanylate cyclase [uncultured bacterium]|uniref:Diguanylate cyclase n=1 Tax=Candidatus Woesebacteria bacterium GW2011_GWA1_40_43 TaxID=1618553 RepID=A0A0G0SIF6_9BACT|nr:MAG: diguanylate cyclase [uncultured bacterium]KKR53787.1 MAG: Diguanylate cyclase [Candidatus Woesebacteria bacterium GW2011_GWD2_40_19]KKR56538.1 MAG: Diguanylate cyclase [Candidatus Woesebacteria bacterium GW2011_GWC2_40_30]KKR64584.1 MAG: Diguanylate cyclase [Candidatus Woesebacteria bacterium GW2011_GWA1_40_43]HAU65428.1 GGDEF domain-containing protein [Candidatus Woesebacteria bacterium]
MSDKITEIPIQVEKPFQREAAKEANETIASIPGGSTVLSNPDLGAEILTKYEKAEELQAEAEELKAENVRDPLTGAFNRRFLDQQLEHKLQSGQKISLIMVDVDHFKEFNDTYGHKNGDRLLIELVRTLSARLRLTRLNGEKDFIARYGGEEFAIILSNVNDSDTAKNVAENLRQMVAGLKFSIDEKPTAKKTVSMGVAVSRDNDTPENLVVRADKALYKAKDNGRNCVEAEPA